MSLGAKQKGTTETVQTPWAAQQPYLQSLFSRADQLYQNQGQPNMGLLNSASGQLQDTISGKNLDPRSNPYFAGALNQTLGDVKSQINSQFRGDNFGNSANQEWLARNMTNAATGMLANQYNLERGNQMQATGMAPGILSAQTNLPWAPLQNYQQAVSGNYGGTQSQPYFTNPMGNAVGGALAGGAIGGPWGAAAGGLFGILGS